MSINFLSNKQVENVSDVAPVGHYLDYMSQQAIWKTFWQCDYKGSTQDSVLDYGCGPCWSVFVGNNLGFKSVTPLEIEAERGGKYDDFYNWLDIHPEFWGGKTMPFADDSFDSVIAKASILKLVDTEFNDLVKELIRVTKNKGSWYISPLYQYVRFNKQLENSKKMYLRHRKIRKQNKTINVRWWTWNIPSDDSSYEIEQKCLALGAKNDKR